MRAHGCVFVPQPFESFARSRLHVQLRWCTVTGEWLLRCLSKRGKVWVDGLSVPHGHAVSLRSGALIQAREICWV